MKSSRPSLLLAASFALAACTIQHEPPTSSNATSTSSGASSTSSGAGGAAADPQVKAWASEVVLGTRFGGIDQVVRWTKSPTLSVITGSAADRAALDELLPELSGLIAPLQIQLVADGDEGADIDVHFTDLASFDAIGQAHGFPIVAGNWGYFYLFWNAKLELTETYVLLATDKLQGADLRHFTFEETTQSLGFGTDSAVFADSIFFADGADGGDAQSLSALDRRLVRFVYSNTQPGDGPQAFGAAFDAHF